jgi:2-polyprenyl-3-methyl-5-hydroxy-6-metoxy-1,4-benzoquinol methylase
MRKWRRTDPSPISTRRPIQHKPASQSYIIRGGIEGRERPRLIARIMRPTALALFERVGVRDGATCLDAGCGGGDGSFELARLIAARGRVVGITREPAP